MKNLDKSKPENSGLRPITVRFSPDAWEAIRDVAAENNLPMAELVRRAVAGNLAEYLGTIRIVDAEQGEEIKSAIISLLGTLSNIENELRRIGVNYNQAVRLKNIERKYSNTRDLSAAKRKSSEEQAIRQECKGFCKADLDTIMDRYETSMKQVGDLLCHILA